MVDELDTWLAATSGGLLAMVHQCMPFGFLLPFL
jgi:hypothetical protein